MANAGDCCSRHTMEALETRRLLSVPGTIQIEDYDTGGEGVAYHDTEPANLGGKYRTDGVDIESTADTGGGFNVGWAKAGEWLRYTTSVTTAGNYSAAFRVASGAAGGIFHLEVDGANVTGAMAVPNTNGWQTWTTISKGGISLTAGQHVLRLVFDSAGASGFVGNFNWMAFQGLVESPYTGSPATAGTTIQAEDFNNGGEGGAYHDTTAANAGGKYRPAEGVDIEGTTDAGGGYNVGWIVPGEWLDYTIDAGAGGSYSFAFRVAFGSAGGSSHLAVDGQAVGGSVAIPNTGGWQNWTTVNTGAIALTGGVHQLRVVFDAAGTGGYSGNLNWLSFNPVAPRTPYLGSPVPISASDPTLVQAENFDTGGEGFTYHDSDAVNVGGAYRPTAGVDIQTTGDGSGHDVGWTKAGEWLEYSVTVPTAGTYNVDFHVASGGAGGKFHLAVDGVNVTGALAVPNTTGWQNYLDVGGVPIAMTAGTHILRLAFDTGGASGYVGNFDYIRFTVPGPTPVQAPAGAPAPRAGVTWTALPVRSAAQAAAGMPGGEGAQLIQSIARSPANDNRIYIGIDVVGVWRSNDGGSTWTPCQQQGFYCLGATSVAASPTNANNLLVYGDQPSWYAPRFGEEGLYQSFDGGDTFTRVLAVSNNDPRRTYRHEIDFAPDGRRVYFASYEQGVFRSDNGGASWTGPLSLQGANIWEIRTDPRNSDVVWAATDNGLMVSRDAGLSFTRVSALGTGPIVAVTPDASTANRIWVVKQGAGLRRSDDGGKTFVAVSTGNTGFDQSALSYFQSPANGQDMLVSSFDSLRVSHNGGRTWATPGIDWLHSYVQQGAWAFTEGYSWSYTSQRLVGGLSCGIYASSDGGLNFADSMTGYTGFDHGWGNAAVAFASSDPNRFAFFCYDYAFNITTDGGQTFTDRPLAQKVSGWWGMYAGDMSPNWDQKPVVIAAAGNYWDNQLVRSENGGQTWTVLPNTAGTYYFVRFDPADASVVYADNLRSDDGGLSFHTLAHPVYAMAASQPDTVYSYDAGHVWRSDDRGDDWTMLPDPPAVAGSSQGRLDMQVDPGDPNRVWVMTPPDAAYYDGTSWQTIAASQWVAPQAHAYVSRVAIDPDNPSRIIIGLEALGTSYLYLSDDGGTTWSDITANLPRQGPGQSLDIQPGTGRIFIGGGFGTWTAAI